MKRDLVALVVTVDVDVDRWESEFGPYEAQDVIDYVAGELRASGSVRAGCIREDLQVRFRRQPKDD